MADSERYVSVVELEAELPFAHEDYPLQDESQFESALERALGAASSMVEEWAGTRYEPTDIEETIARPAHVPDSDLPLPKRPIQSIESVAVEGETLSEDDDYVVSDTHLSLVAEPTSGIDEWPTDSRSITVDWSYGFDDAPEPVREVVIRLARNALDQIETDGYVSDDAGWSYRPPTDIKAECAAIVSNYEAPSYYSGAMIV